MYDLYNLELQSKIDEVQKDLNDLEVLKNKLASYFRNNEVKVIPITKLEEGNLDVIENPQTSKQKLFNINVKHYNNCMTLYKNKVQQKKIFNKSKIKKQIFLFILKRFNELLVQKLIYSSYKFKHLYIGGFSVICNKNKNNVIDWGKSIKNKEKLLKAGEVPYTKEGEAKALEANQDYNGKQWLEYLPDYSLFFQWDLANGNFIRIPNIKNFTFVPLRGNTSPVAELSSYRKTLTDEECINKYKRSTDGN